MNNLKASALNILLLSSLFGCFSAANAQERLSGLISNPEVVNKNKSIKNALKSAQITDTIKVLPFVDDFSSLSVIPDKNLWIDKKAYINSNYSIDPPSIGVATLDAIDETGHIYRAVTKTFYADELTSRPINLSPSMDRVFLSFYYQAGGVGFVPSKEDFLSVEFFHPVTRNWTKKWPLDTVSAVKLMPGYSETSFSRIFIPVDTAFLKKGFQFRFRNKATLDASQYIGKHGNAAIWNIDYVKLDKDVDTTQKSFQDVAIVSQPTTLLSNYYSIPWRHYEKAFQTELKPTIEVTVRNNDVETRLVDWPTFQINEISRPVTNRSYFTELLGNSSNIPEFSTRTLSTNLIKPFAPYWKVDTIVFDVKTVLTTDVNDYHKNDTAHFKQVFSNYMAYDDGSAEAGYGVYGDGAENAKIAYAFNSYVKDTLRGIQIYFAPTERDTSSTFEFILEIRNDNNGMPGGIIKSSNNIKPRIGALNQLYTFMLDTGVAVPNKFYIGWRQITNDFLNIGMDLNHNNSNKLFINLKGTWQNSIIKGSLMLRPVFRNAREGFTTGKKPVIGQSFSVSPNPATDILNIETGQSLNHPLDASIYTVSGKLVLSRKFMGTSLDVSALPTGLYILRLSGENTTFAPTKFLIQR